MGVLRKETPEAPTVERAKGRKKEIPFGLGLPDPEFNTDLTV